MHLTPGTRKTVDLCRGELAKERKARGLKLNILKPSRYYSAILEGIRDGRWWRTS